MEAKDSQRKVFYIGPTEPLPRHLAELIGDWIALSREVTKSGPLKGEKHWRFDGLTTQLIALINGRFPSWDPSPLITLAGIEPSSMPARPALRDLQHKARIMVEALARRLAEEARVKETPGLNLERFFTDILQDQDPPRPRVEESAPTAYLGLILDKKQMQIHRKGFPSVCLRGPTLWNILELLMANGAAITNETAIRERWSDDPKGGPLAIRDPVNRLNKQLKPLGVSIKSERAFGWRLVEE
jgi:hypothetical protein